MDAFGQVTCGIALLAVGFNAGIWALSMRRIRSWRSLVRDGPDPPHWPRTHVFVCLKGDLPGIRETVLALDRQDYPGEYRVTFVTESGPEDGDLAARQLAEVLPRACRSDRCVAGRVLDSGLRCAQKNFNLLAGIRHAERTRGSLEVYAFCDGDLLVEPGWLREMVRPIASGRSDASTTFHYAASEDNLLVGTLHGIAETFQSIASLVCRGTTWGGSMAIRTAAFRSCALADIWSRTVVDDVTMTRVLKKSGLVVAPIARFLVSSRSEIGSFRGFVRWLGRQLFFVKVYLPSRYHMIWAKIFLDGTAVWLGTFHASYRLIRGEWPAGALAGGSAIVAAAGVLAAFHLCRYLLPERPPLRAWLGAALLVHAVGLLACADASLRRKRLTWRDLTYFVERNGQVSRVTGSRTPEPVPAEEPLPEEALA